MKKNCCIILIFIFALFLNCQEDEEINANIDERLAGKWAQYYPAEFMGDHLKGYYVYDFHDNGKYDLKFCKDVYCEIVKYKHVINGKFENKNKNYIIMEEEDYINNNLLNMTISDTYHINENVFYYGGVYIKTKYYRDNTIYGKYENKYKIIETYSETGLIYSEHIRYSTIYVKTDNTIKKTEYYKYFFDNKENFRDEEETTIIYDDYDFEDLGDRLVIKYPEKKYYTDEGKGPYYLHDIIYYENYGDVLRLGSKDLYSTPVKPPPYYQYNSEKGVLENIYGFYEPYKKVE